MTADYRDFPTRSIFRGDRSTTNASALLTAKWRGCEGGRTEFVEFAAQRRRQRVKDVARRLADADFIAFAPNALTSLGGYLGDDEKGLALFGQLDRAKMTEDFLAAANWLRARPDSAGKLGALGFCFGGGVVNQLAVRMGSDLAAGVPFYGAQPSAAEAVKIKTPINAQYGEFDKRIIDKRITDGWPAFDAAANLHLVASLPHMTALRVERPVATPARGLRKSPKPADCLFHLATGVGSWSTNQRGRTAKRRVPIAVRSCPRQ